MSTAVLELLQFDYFIVDSTTLSDRSELSNLNRKIESLVKEINTTWDSMSSDDKKKWEALAYRLIEIEDVEANKFILIRIFRSFFSRIRLQLKGSVQDIEKLGNSIQSLISTILCCIESDSSIYQAILSDTLEKLEDDPQSGEVLELGEFSDWFQRVSDKARSEV